VPIISELRQRRIVQWLLSYIAGAFLALEALDQFTDRNYLPDIFYDIGFIWIVVAGLPAALIIGWYHGEKGEQQAPPLEIGLLSTLGILALVLSGFVVVKAGATLPEMDDQLDTRSLAVLYFDGANLDPEHRYLADAVTEDLISELSAVSALNVVSRNGSALVRDTDLRLDSIARLLDAGTLVDGVLEQRGDRIRLSLSLVDGRSGAAIRRTSLERPAFELLQLRNEVVVESSRLLREWLGEELNVRQRGAGTSVVEAWSLVQQAERLRKDGIALQVSDHDAGIGLFDRADGLLARAELLDTTWIEPVVLRSQLAFTKSRAQASTAASAVEDARAAVAHGERAVQRDRNHARALEQRGTALYWLHLLGVTPDPGQDRELRDRARADLERALQLDRRLASAYYTLHHLQGRSGAFNESLISAQRAYEEDAFLDAAPQILWGLFRASYEMESLTQAQRWCSEGARRFPENYRFAVCELDLMLTSASQAEPDRAWRLVARIDSLAPASEREYQVVQSTLTAAGVLARAGQADSARAVLRRTRGEIVPQIDPNNLLPFYAAHAYVLLEDHDAAIALIHELIARGADFAGDDRTGGWRWRPLERDPRFRQVLGS
jgi:TolB-like protein